MKLSDYVMEFLKTKGVKTVFMLPGGGCMHLVDSLGKNKDMEYICCLHEQAASIAAESYAQNTNELGAALVTTGPGGTNTITGLTAAWIDSTPVMFISGQVKRSDLMGTSGVRQMGSQEVDIVSLVKPITKFAQTVLDPATIRYTLEKAYHLAMTGRRGPVWIDIPLDVQAMDVDAEAMTGYLSEESLQQIEGLKIDEIVSLLKHAKRPLLLAGNGVKLAGCEEQLRTFIKNTQIPVLLTWKSIDMLDYQHPQYFGCPGGMGHRYANFILQNADLLIVMGSRLDSSLTAFNHERFAPGAKKIMIDIDCAEIRKMKMKLDVQIAADVKDVLNQLNKRDCQPEAKALNTWQSYCRTIKAKYPAITPEMENEREFVNAHVFINELCQQLTPTDIIVPESSGGAGEITYQAFEVKAGQKIKNAAGLGSMGFGLPYALGACIANNRRRTILINGDGAFQLNIQELATVAQHKLPIKIFIWENGGYASIMGTQRNYFAGNYVGANKESNLCMPDIGKIAAAYGLKTSRIEKPENLGAQIAAVLSMDGPVLCEVRVSPMETASPRTQAMKLPDGSMISKPLEDMWPYLSEAELKENMKWR